MNQMITAPVQAGKVRFGCFAAKIDAMFPHKLEANLTLRSGRVEAAGRTVHLTIQDLSRHPEAEPHAKWRCLHPDCNGRRWDSKKALVAEHKPNRELERLEEVHCYYAVAHIPGSPAKEEKKGKTGEVLEIGEPARLPTVMLLSDEE